ncbi:MAG: NAD(P)/FAD-dependent oxidoreductase [Planctomycetes bacterium]|nr:NAD(P)/FAD-dependent oxidoreductase [Planctomycetota bacterium]
MDVEIVGAGFAGLACAQACAVRGLRVRVLDRKREPGSAPHTTGLLVKEVADEWDVPRAITRKIRGVRLYSPSHRWIDLQAPGYFFLATDTPALLRWLAQRAADAGAELRWNADYRGEREGRILVGADGPRSLVARLHGLGVNDQFLTGVEAEFDGVAGVDPDRLHVFLDSELAPGYIGWVVPGMGMTQVGLACRRPRRLDLFVDRLRGLFDFSRARRIGVRGGLIPVGGRVSPFAASTVVLVGDAAGLVSPLTAGGIHTALDSGRRAGLAIAEHLLDGGRPLPRLLADAYPSFFWKRWLRRAIDLRPPNSWIDAALSNPLFRSLARTLFFHRRGLRFLKSPAPVERPRGHEASPVSAPVPSAGLRSGGDSA